MRGRRIVGACMGAVCLAGVVAARAYGQQPVREAVGLKDAQLAFWYREVPGDWGPIEGVWAYTGRVDLRLPRPWNRLGIVWGVQSETGQTHGTIRHAETGESYRGRIRFEATGMLLGLKANTPPGWWRRGYVYAMGGGVFKGVDWVRREVSELEVATPIHLLKPDRGWKDTGFGAWGEVGVVVRVWKRLQLGVGWRAEWVLMELAGERRNAGGLGPVFVILGYQHAPYP